MIDLTDVKVYDNSFINNDSEIIKTTIKIDDIEDRLNNLLTKHNEICEYVINLNDHYWSVNFKVSKVDSLETLIMTSFQINLFKDKNQCSIIELSNEIKKFNEWNFVFKDLIRNFKKN